MMIMMDMITTTRMIVSAMNHISSAIFSATKWELQNFVFRGTRSARSSPQAGGRRTAHKAGSVLNYRIHREKDRARRASKAKLFVLFLNKNTQNPRELPGECKTSEHVCVCFCCFVFDKKTCKQTQNKNTKKVRENCRLRVGQMFIYVCVFCLLKNMQTMCLLKIQNKRSERTTGWLYDKRERRRSWWGNRLPGGRPA